MALTKFQKGMTGLVIALIAVVAIGYAGLRYLENAVVEAIRTWAAQTPETTKVQLGEVTYSLPDNRLVLTQVRVDATVGDKKYSTSTERLTVENPGTTLLRLLADPTTELKEAELPVADVIRAERTTITPEPALTQGEYTLRDIRIDTATLKTLLSAEDKKDIVWLVSYGLSYKESSSKNLACTLPIDSGKTLTVEIAESQDQGFVKGHLDASTSKDIRVLVQDQEVLRIASIALENLNMPPQELRARLEALTPDTKDEEAFPLLEELFSGPQPLLGKLMVRDVKATLAPLGSATLSAFGYTNTSTAPYGFETTVEHLKLPLAFVPELQSLSLVGLTDVDLNASFALTLPNTDGQFTTTASFGIAQLGTTDASLSGILPAGTFAKVAQMGSETTTPEQQAALEAELEKNIKIGRIELGYADEGLMSRLALLGQKFFGMSLEAEREIYKKYIATEVIDSETPDPAVLAKFMEFADKPGAIRITYAPTAPLSLKALDEMPAGKLVPSVDVTPGPKTIEELLTELSK